MKIVILVMVLAFPIAALAQSASLPCPKISVEGSNGITAVGDAMQFRAKVGNDRNESYGYSWQISAGTIESGQNTAAISVRTDASLSGANVKATVTVSGLGTGCSNSAFEVAPVESLPIGEPIDQFGKLRRNDRLSRYDTFFAELENNSDQLGFVMLYYVAKTSDQSINRRVSEAVKHAKFRGFDVSRIQFWACPHYDVSTSFWRAQKGAISPDGLSSCRLLSNSDVHK